jgi:hypothetical protein
MPASSPLNEPPPTIADHQSAGDPGTSPAARLVAERTERRRQRAATHNAPTPPRQARRARPRERPPGSRSALTPPRHMALRDSVSVTLIAVLSAGGVLGAILGALSATGWGHRTARGRTDCRPLATAPALPSRLT